MKNVQNSLYHTSQILYETIEDHDADVTTINNSLTTINNTLTTILGDIITINNTLNSLVIGTESFSRTFRANGYAPGIEDRTVFFYGQKIGQIATLYFQKHFWSFIANSNNWTMNSTLPIGWRPFSNSQCLFSAMNGGTEDTNNDVDILGMAWVNTNGDIILYKEPPPGTGVWGTDTFSGYRAFSITYRIA